MNRLVEHSRRAFETLRLALAESRPSGLFVPLMLGLLVLVSALWVVRVKHDNRTLTTELERARVERERMQMEWSQLQLEEAALAHNARIERSAREELGMAEPREYLIIDQTASERAP